jgi:DNA-directed RNA polymerase subunit K/omega
MEEDYDKSLTALDEYKHTLATLLEYEKIASWWSTTLYSLDTLKKWLFLYSGGFPLFQENLGLTKELEKTIDDTVVKKLKKLVVEAGKKVKQFTNSAFNEDSNEVTIETIGSSVMLIHGEKQYDMSSLWPFYNKIAYPNPRDAELVLLSQNWTLETVEPSVSRLGPSGRPLSHSYYEALKEYFGVTTHLFSTITTSYYQRFGTSWLFGAKQFGAVDFIKNLIEESRGESRGYEVNLLFLGSYYILFLEYILDNLADSILFVVHEETPEAPIRKPFYSTKIVGVGRVFSVYVPKNRVPPTEKQLKVLGLMLGNPRDKRTIGIPFVSDYERTVIVGTRAEQIARGSKPRVAVNPTEVDPVPIAAREFLEKKTGMLILRKFPNGEEEILNPDDIGVESHASPINPLL